MVNSNGMNFDVYIHDELFGHFDLPFFGAHMLQNSLANITLDSRRNGSKLY